MNQTICLLLAAALLNACNMKKEYTPEQIKETSAAVNAFLDKKFDEAVARNPEFATNLGLKTGYGDWSDRSDAFWDNEVAIMRSNIDSLSKFDTAALDASTKLSVQLYKEDYKLAEEGLKWRLHGYWISQMSGEHNDLPAFLINQHSIESSEDAQAYISRLSKIEAVLNQVVSQLKVREANGVIPPYFTFSYVTADIQAFVETINKDLPHNILYADFKEKLAKTNIDAEQQKALLQQAASVLTTSVKKGY